MKIFPYHRLFPEKISLWLRKRILRNHQEVGTPFSISGPAALSGPPGVGWASPGGLGSAGQTWSQTRGWAGRTAGGASGHVSCAVSCAPYPSNLALPACLCFANDRVRLVLSSLVSSTGTVGGSIREEGLSPLNSASKVCLGPEVVLGEFYQRPTRLLPASAHRPWPSSPPPLFPPALSTWRVLWVAT